MINNFLFDSILLDDYDKFVENLYNYSSLIDLKNQYGESLLHFCCFYGMIDKYYALINFDAKISLTNSKNNLLHYAAFSGNDDFLIVELRDNEGNTILHTSYRYGFLNTMSYWKNLFPNLVNIKNKDNQLWNEVRISNKNFCKG